MLPNHDRDQDLRKPIEATSRFGRFLDRTIGELKSEGQQPMAEVPPNKMPEASKKDELVPSLTGALTLADGLMQRIARAKARHDNANAKVEQAFGKLDGASDALEGLASKAEAEADAVLAKLGQVSNS